MTNSAMRYVINLSVSLAASTAPRIEGSLWRTAALCQCVLLAAAQQRLPFPPLAAVVVVAPIEGRLGIP